jgi:hypothetical protein
MVDLPIISAVVLSNRFSPAFNRLVGVRFIVLKTWPHRGERLRSISSNLVSVAQLGRRGHAPT